MHQEIPPNLKSKWVFCAENGRLASQGHTAKFSTQLVNIQYKENDVLYVVC